MNFQSHFSLFQLKFLGNFWLSVILIYDIHNKISKLDLLGHFCFWPLLASFKGHWKTFMLMLIQRWLVGRFEGLIKGLQHAQFEPKVTNSFWVIQLSSNFYLHQDLDLNRGCIEAELKSLGLIWCNGASLIPTWGLKCS